MIYTADCSIYNCYFLLVYNYVATMHSVAFYRIIPFYIYILLRNCSIVCRMLSIAFNKKKLEKYLAIKIRQIFSNKKMFSRGIRKRIGKSIMHLFWLRNQIGKYSWFRRARLYGLYYTTYSVLCHQNFKYKKQVHVFLMPSFAVEV